MENYKGKSKIKEMKNLISELNAASDMYYNTSNTIMSDKEWDMKLDKLKELEEKTGIILSNSPTINVGYEVKSKLEELGAIVESGYKKSLDYLIVANDSSKSRKEDKALKDGVKLFTEEELMNLIKG